MLSLAHSVTKMASASMQQLAASADVITWLEANGLRLTRVMSTGHLTLFAIEREHAARYRSDADVVAFYRRALGTLTPVPG
jgi:hypothetical protein